VSAMARNPGVLLLLFSFLFFFGCDMKCARSRVQVISTGGFVRNPANITDGFDVLLTSA